MQILAFVLLENNKPHEAINLWKGLLVFSPHDPQIHKSLARAYFDTKYYDLAIEHGHKYMELNASGEKTAPMEFLISRAYWAINKQNDAQKWAQSSLEVKNESI